MTDRDDDDWFEALAGRAGADGEAQALRRALLRWPLQAPLRALDQAREDAKEEERLIALARLRGLLGPRRCAGCGRRARWLADLWQRCSGGPQGWAVGLAAAALGAFLVLPQAPAPEPVAGQAPPTWRAEPGGLLLLTHAQPMAWRDRIAAELAAAGVSPLQRYERLGRFGLDATLPQPLPAAVAEVLRRHGLPAPADGVLRLEVAPKP